MEINYQSNIYTELKISNEISIMYTTTIDTQCITQYQIYCEQLWT